MWNKRSKISKVIWEDTDKTLIKVFFENISEPALESIDAPGWLVEKVKKQYTIDDIDRETNDYHKYIGERTVIFEQFMEDFVEWKQWKEIKKKTADPVISDKPLSHILNIAHDKSSFFKLKLEIFEIDAVKNSKKREWKASLRKATTTLELLSLLYKELPDLGSELILADQQIPLQDVTNQPDTQDSGSAEDVPSSDAPTA